MRLLFHAEWDSGFRPKCVTRRQNCQEGPGILARSWALALLSIQRWGEILSKSMRLLPLLADPNCYPGSQQASRSQPPGSLGAAESAVGLGLPGLESRCLRLPGLPQQNLSCLPDRSPRERSILRAFERVRCLHKTIRSHIPAQGPLGCHRPQTIAPTVASEWLGQNDSRASRGEPASHRLESQSWNRLQPRCQPLSGAVRQALLEYPPAPAVDPTPHLQTAALTRHEPPAQKAVERFAAGYQSRRQPHHLRSLVGWSEECLSYRSTIYNRRPCRFE